MQNRREPGPEPGGAISDGEPAVNDAPAGAQRASAGDAANTVARRFPPACVSVREARWFLLEHLRGNGYEDLDSAALMLSELATNAVEHADTAFEVHITVAPHADGGRSVHVRVTDEARGFRVPTEPALDEGRGRGLRIIESLADGWGIDRHGPAGKTVWFTSRLATALVASPRGDQDKVNDLIVDNMSLDEHRIDDVVVLAAQGQGARAGTAP